MCDRFERFSGSFTYFSVCLTSQEELEGKMTCDRQLLERLGLVKEGEEPEDEEEEEDQQRQRKTEVDGPVLYPHHTWDNLSTPVVASAVSMGQIIGEKVDR